MQNLSPEHEDQLARFEAYVNDVLVTMIGRIVSRYAVRFTWMVVVLTIGATGWATKMQMDLVAIRDAQTAIKGDVDLLKKVQEATNTATTARIVDWSQWRVLKDSADDNYERRLAWLETVERTRQ